jgi:hypothetical protein
VVSRETGRAAPGDVRFDSWHLGVAAEPPFLRQAARGKIPELAVRACGFAVPRADREFTGSAPWGQRRDERGEGRFGNFEQTENIPKQYVPRVSQIRGHLRLLPLPDCLLPLVECTTGNVYGVLAAVTNTSQTHCLRNAVHPYVAQHGTDTFRSQSQLSSDTPSGAKSRCPWCTSSASASHGRCRCGF